MTEPSNANHSIIEISNLCSDRPEVILPRIMRTNFWDLNSTCELSCFFDVLGRAAIIGRCLIPLRYFNDVTYFLSPMSSILQLQDKVQDQQPAEPAPASYFCVQKQDLDQVGQLPWGGSSASPLQTYATNIACTLSLRFVNSKDSGYLSENAHLVPKNLLTVSEGKAEEQAGFGLFDRRKAFVQKRERTLSLHFVCFKDSGYLSGDPRSVLKSLAAILKDRIDEQAEQVLAFNKLLYLVIHSKILCGYKRHNIYMCSIDVFQHICLSHNN